MVELIIAVATLTVVIMAWSKINNALDWTGKEIAKTSSILSNVTEAGSEQTLRGVVISRDSLLNTMSDFKEKNANRIKKETAFKSKLKEKDEIKAYDEGADYLAKLLTRQDD